MAEQTSEIFKFPQWQKFIIFLPPKHPEIIKPWYIMHLDKYLYVRIQEPSWVVCTAFIALRHLRHYFSCLFLLLMWELRCKQYRENYPTKLFSCPKDILHADYVLLQNVMGVQLTLSVYTVVFPTKPALSANFCDTLSPPKWLHLS